MQWNQIKTLFILCFLVLDVYLLIQFFDKQEKNDLDVVKEQDSSIEQQLKLEDIHLPELTDEEVKQSYISVEQKDLSDVDEDEIPSSDNQKLKVIDDKMLVSKFDKPVSVKEKDDLQEVVENNALSAEDYTYWKWNTDLDVVMFFQKKKDQPVYYNDKGLLLLYLNDDNEVVGYTQTMLGDEKEDFDTDEESLIKPIQAVYTLYENDLLKSGDEITEPEIGYYTSEPIVSDEQIFAPTWRITVDGDVEREYFIHAKEGMSLPNDDQMFLKESMQKVKSSLSEVKDDKDFKKISEQLEERLKAIKREEEE